MNINSLKGNLGKIKHKISFHSRILDLKTKTGAFGVSVNPNTIQRIYVINLDRKPDRWQQVRREIGRITDDLNRPLTQICRRFSAIDARYIESKGYRKELRSSYSLADQLQVEPNSKIKIDQNTIDRRIEMTSQEVAVALSHIEVWKLIASGDVKYTLVLEDDTYFVRKFCTKVDKLWKDVTNQTSELSSFDLLYLSFQEVGPEATSRKITTKLAHKPNRGIWQASGYVLSKSGAEKLIELLPAYGPIDLWLNLQFNNLNVLVPDSPIIEQRIDVPSTNSYSIMPVLSQIGVHTKEKPLVAKSRYLPGPIFAYGKPGSGLTALSKALSMLGYTCCSDITELAPKEYKALHLNKRGRTFNAYVNIGSIDSHARLGLMKAYPNFMFISTSEEVQDAQVSSNQMLYLPPNHKDRWAALSDFLNLEYPTFSYPSDADIGQRTVTQLKEYSDNFSPHSPLKFDSSPWIISKKDWNGIAVIGAEEDRSRKNTSESFFPIINNVNDDFWNFRGDTFPSNLALFKPANVKDFDSQIASIVFQEEYSPVRDYTSGALVSTRSFSYGTFSACIRPSNAQGLISGIFLHRNSPHQEIDIEFLGKDTTKILINVFYNPGVEGTKLEYGYRGTPVLIDLGFNASDDFHEYTIDWSATSIRWLVDGNLVYERRIWDPTPIPDLPMEFNINLWHSRSKELSGKLDVSKVPAQTEIKSVYITSSR